jgi:hypothetical protein
VQAAEVLPGVQPGRRISQSWPLMAADLEAAEQNVKLLNMQFERVAAERELRGYGINASPADVEQWVASSPRQKRRLMELLAAMDAAYSS